MNIHAAEPEIQKDRETLDREFQERTQTQVAQSVEALNTAYEQYAERTRGLVASAVNLLGRRIASPDDPNKIDLPRSLDYLIEMNDIFKININTEGQQFMDLLNSMLSVTGIPTSRDIEELSRPSELKEASITQAATPAERWKKVFETVDDLTSSERQYVLEYFQGYPEIESVHLKSYLKNVIGLEPVESYLIRAKHTLDPSLSTEKRWDNIHALIDSLSPVGRSIVYHHFQPAYATDVDYIKYYLTQIADLWKIERLLDSIIVSRKNLERERQMQEPKPPKEPQAEYPSIEQILIPLGRIKKVLVQHPSDITKPIQDYISTYLVSKVNFLIDSSIKKISKAFESAKQEVIS